MLDIHFVREHPDLVRDAARHKKVAVDVDRLLALDEKRRALQPRIDDLRSERNELARKSATLRQVTVAEPSGGGAPRELITVEKRARAVREELDRLEADEADFAATDREFEALLRVVPNIPTPDTPVGTDESANRVLREVGEKPSFDFPPKEHWLLGRDLGVIDNERAAPVAGSRFTYLLGDLALLEFALIQHALSLLTSAERLAALRPPDLMDVPTKPFIPVIPPVLVRPDALQRMARLEPREERYYIPTDDLYLVGSAEHTLGAMHMDETLREEDLPRRYAGFSAAFRREAGSHGKDVHGILRMHQFDKLEIESFTTAEASRAEQDFIVAIQEHLMQSLEIPYRVVLVCTGEMGAPDSRQIDIEAWFPGQNRYRETHTADLMTDYQARRLKTRVRRASGKLEFVHTNDATVFAIGRTLAALLEVHQTSDGGVKVPKCLRPLLGGKEILSAVNRTGA